MSDDFTFDDFDDDSFGDEPPKPPAGKTPRPAMPPTAPPTAAPVAPKSPASPVSSRPAPPPPPMDFSQEYDDFGDEPALSEETGKDWKGKEPGGNRRRTLLLLLLLILAGGGAYYYLYGIPGLEPPIAPSSQNKPVAKPLPAPKPAAPAAKPQEPSTKPAANVASQPQAPTAPAVPSGATPAAPAASAQAQTPPSKPAVSTAPVGPASTAAPPAATVTPPPTTPAKAPAPLNTQPVPVASAAGDFYLTAGPFIYRSNAEAAEKKLRDLGYNPGVQTVKRSTEMTRLRLGTYPPQEADALRTGLSKRYPGAFIVVKDDQWIVYAGSFHEVDQARKLADKLYQDGYRVTEEKATVKVPMQLVKAGAFTDRNSAEQAALQLRNAGLPVEIAKR